MRSIQSESDPRAPSWGLGEQLLASAVDTLNVLAWMQSKDGQKNRNRPKPIRRPGVDAAEHEERVIGSAPVPLSELDEFLQWGPSPAQPATQPRDSRGRFIRRDP